MTAVTSPKPTPISPPPPLRVYRIEVHPNADQPDPLATAALPQAQHTVSQEIQQIRTAGIYLIEASLDDHALNRIAQELLADPVNQHAVIGAADTPLNAATVEVHYLPGVMDPVAQSTRDAIVEMLPHLSASDITVRTGRRYDLLHTPDTHVDSKAVRRFAETALANPVINDIHTATYHPIQFPHGNAYQPTVTHVPIDKLDDDGLAQLSRDGHLFLNLDEMRTIQAHYRQANRQPTDIELETLAQTWSEHCVHKTLKATIRYTQSDSSEKAGVASSQPAPQDWASRPGHKLESDGSVTITNLLKSTIAAATFKLMEQAPHKQWCVSVFEDNAGIVRFDDEHAVCIKVETHNHPSAIEPYGGAATGIGGCIRDIMGTGLAARPIANTDTFCVAPPNRDQPLPTGVIHPRRVLGRVVEGVRDYGNRMGIPTVNGAVWFHEDYLGNPLVFAGCVGIMPIDKCFGTAQPGDRIIALGGRTGRDGIHGATFSSAELTDTHADQFSHAVQIGNAITQKKTLDVILQARDHPQGTLFTAITDCGAGGFSSAVGEMGEKVGAHVTLETAPLKYQGLTYTEIWISEAQERMVLAVPAKHVEMLQQLCQAEDVEMCDLGQFGAGPEDDPQLILIYQGTQVGQLSMQFLHDGLPMPTRAASWGISRDGDSTPTTAQPSGTASDSIGDALYALLGHLNIASKHWIIRQYDHEVQGTSVVKPLVGPGQDGPSDAAVLRPKLTGTRGVAIASGLQPGLGEKAPGGHGDSYWMTLAAIDEAVRNCVCVGADPSHIAILDNFCWPNCDDPAQLGSLVRAAQACYDGALAYRTPFVSGKDSLSNQFTTEDGKLITIPPTLLITALGIVNDVTRCRTMDAKASGNHLLLVGQTTPCMGGSHYVGITTHAGSSCDLNIPRVDLNTGPKTAMVIATLIAAGHVASAHDCSDGGLLVAAAEMAFAGRVGLDLDLDQVPATEPLSPVASCFAETPSRYLLEVAPHHLDPAANALRDAGIAFATLGTFADHDRLTARNTADGQLLDEPLDKLRDAWLAPLDW